MTGTSIDPRRAQRLLLAFAVAGGLVRAWPLLLGGAWGVPVDYDEGVYFSAAGLLARGVWPYRDFLFVHPPGLPLALTSIAWAGPAAFVWARWLSVALGACSIYLVGNLVRRHAGVFCGLVAAAVYASYPEASGAERGVFLEPALNLACLGAAWLLLNEEVRRWAPWMAGAAVGVAVSTKLVGGIALVSLALVTWAHPPWRRRLPAFLAGAVVAGTLVCGPFLLRAPAAFVHQVIAFQLLRPPDNGGTLVARALRIFAGGHALAWVLAAVGLLGVGLRWRAASPFERAVAMGYLLVLATFLSAKAYWGQYNAHLAVYEAPLAGLGAGELWRRWGRSAGRYPLVAAAAFGLFFALRTAARRAATGPRLEPFATQAAAALQGQRCAFSFEPAWTFPAGLFPGPAPYIVDPYGQMLWDAIAQGATFPDAAAAFADGRSQTTVRAAMERCPWLVLGPRGRRQLSPDSWSWVQQAFTPVVVQTTQSAPDLWVRRSPGR